MATKDEDTGFWDKHLSNPWVGGAYALGNALLAGATPGTARISQGLNQGLRTIMAAEGRNLKEKKDRRLSEALDKITPGGKSVTPPGAMPADPRISEQGLPPGSPVSMPAPRTSLMTTPVVQEYLRALPPKLRAEMTGKILTQKPEAPVSVRPGGALVDPRTGRPIYNAPPAPARERGPMAVSPGSTVIDPRTGEEIFKAPPTPPGPPTPKTPEELDLLRARTAQAMAGAEQSRANAARTNEIAKQIKDPKVSRERLTTIYSNLLRRQQMLRDMHPEPGEQGYLELQNVNALLGDAEARLAEVVRRGQAPSGDDPNDPLGIRGGNRVVGGEY